MVVREPIPAEGKGIDAAISIIYSQQTESIGAKVSDSQQYCTVFVQHFFFHFMCLIIKLCNRCIPTRYCSKRTPAADTNSYTHIYAQSTVM